MAAHPRHVREIGFTHAVRSEDVYLARVSDLPRPRRAEWTQRRCVGVNGTRISATTEDGQVLGYVEVDTNLDDAARTSRTGDWADVGNLHVDADHRRRGVGSWLLGQAAEWLELGGVTRLLDYADAEDTDTAAFLLHVGFRQLTRTIRGLEAQAAGQNEMTS